MSDLAVHVPDTPANPATAPRVHTRRSALKGSAGAVAALAGSRMPFGVAVLAEAAFAGEARAQAGTDATAALQLALRLELLEQAFYEAGYARFRAAGGTVTSAAQRFTPGEDAVIAAVLAHETAHVALLRAALGASAPPPAAAYDFTGGGGAGNGPFATAIGTPATANKAAFFRLAQLLEDLGVRAYAGQVGGLAGTPAAATAARVLTVEARHAALVRILRTSAVTLGAGTQYTVTPWPGFATTTAGLFDSGFTTAVAASGQSQATLAAAVYGPATPVVGNVQAPSAGEDNVVQVSSQATTTLAVNANTGNTAGAEAFDEPMTAAAVTTVLAFFGAS